MHYSEARALADDATRCFAADAQTLKAARDAIQSITGGIGVPTDSDRLARIRLALGKIDASTIQGGAIRAVVASDPARSALSAFVSACGGNPPDWLKEEHAAENALAGDVGKHPHAVALRQVRGLATWESAKAKGEIYRIATEALGGEMVAQALPGSVHASLLALLPLAEARAEELEMLAEGDEGGSMDAKPFADAARKACDDARDLVLSDTAPEPWHALECAQFWLQEERDSERPGQTSPDDILRVIGDALAGRPMAPLTADNVKADLASQLRFLGAIIGTHEQQGRNEARQTVAYVAGVATQMLSALRMAAVICEDAYHDALALQEEPSDYAAERAQSTAAALAAWELVKATIAAAAGREG